MGWGPIYPPFSIPPLPPFFQRVVVWVLIWWGGRGGEGRGKPSREMDDYLPLDVRLMTRCAGVAAAKGWRTE